MKLERRFYDSSTNLRNISVERLVLSLYVGLASAFVIYAFFYVLRESFRVLSFGFENYPNILSEKDRDFYNIFFAGLSLIFANSIFINLIFSKPQQVLNRLNPKRKRILNDQIFLSFNFSYWFTKIGLVFGVFSMCCMDFNFLPFFKPLSFLLLFVLYLESWKNLSWVFKRNRLKMQFLHLLILLLLVFGLSRINVINYRALDELSIRQNPIIDLPYSDFSNDKGDRFGLEASLKLKMNEHNNLEIFTDGKEKINLKGVGYFVMRERAARREELFPFLTIRIVADKDIDIKYIKMLEAELFSVNQRNIVYDIQNPDLIISRFEKIGISKWIAESVLDVKFKNDIPMPPLPPNDASNYDFTDTLNISIQKNVRINGKEISKDNLIQKFKKHIKPQTLFLYSYNPGINYQDYITVLSSHFAAAYELRKNEQTIFRDNEYDHNEAYKKEQLSLKEKYPVIIKEKFD